jgi:hypothetical protein
MSIPGGIERSWSWASRAFQWSSRQESACLHKLSSSISVAGAMNACADVPANGGKMDLKTLVSA